VCWDLFVETFNGITLGSLEQMIKELIDYKYICDVFSGHHSDHLVSYDNILQQVNQPRVTPTLLKLVIMKDTKTGSSTKAMLISLPIPSAQGISLIIFKVMGLEEISIK
jgi:hypothetical protein